MERVSNIFKAEQDIIKRGLTPQEGSSIYDCYFGKIENYEQRIINGLENNYEKAIEFFTNGKEKEQVKIAQEGY